METNDTNSRVLQMAPTIFHQSRAIIQLMQKYNWTDFTVVTTTSSDDLEFINSIQDIVNRHNNKRSTTRVNSSNVTDEVFVINIRGS
ncbi:hypothetical protein KUTeg_002959 [Tegillarca granosa]|uniref:Receptor ligand binding region domain-containing protein n=1 Tax=Tegillarca granosa TaxID=220873 RepID=A0ABQ9FKQ4_TEGGR|nr:hypothetical protein KUTeg_002959 [Tegillarca granosa]